MKLFATDDPFTVAYHDSHPGQAIWTVVAAIMTTTQPIHADDPSTAGRDFGGDHGPVDQTPLRLRAHLRNKGFRTRTACR